MSDGAAALEPFTIFWFDGLSCDGCTVAVIGDDSCMPIERLLNGEAEGLPRLELVHPMLSMESGDDFLQLLRRGARGDVQFGLVIESAMSAILSENASFGWCGSESDGPVDIGTWVRRLADHAEFVLALGDCAVFGGPHAPDDNNPSRSTGVEVHLGFDYRSRSGLPVIHLPGCSVPPVAVATLVSVLRWLQGDGPRPELDELGRPSGIYV